MAKFCITGVKKNGQRFSPIYTNHPENYNIWRDTVWRLDSEGNKTKE